MFSRFAEEILIIIRVRFVGSVLIEILGHDSISIKILSIERESHVMRSLEFHSDLKLFTGLANAALID